MQYLRADTNTEVLIGPVVAVGDGFTPVTTLSLSTADEAEIIKYGGATALTVTDISASTMSAITGADGYYTLDISTGNSDTEGFLTVLINDDSLCLPVRHDFMVVNANVYDSLFAAATTDYLQVDTIQRLGTAVTNYDYGIVAKGTAQAATGTTIQLASAETFADDELIGATVVITGGSAGVGQARIITDYVSTTDTATVDTWTTTPTGTITYIVIGTPPSSSTSPIPASLSGTQTFNMTGNITGNLSGSVGSVTGAVGSVTGAVGSVTGNVGGNVVGSVASVTGAVGSVTGNVGGNVTGSVGSLGTTAKSDVNAEVLDVLNTDTFAEPGQGAPGATISLAAKIGYLYKAWRNRSTQTASQYTLYNDDATTVDQKATFSDDTTTADRGEIATGP